MPFYHQNDNESFWIAIHHFTLYLSSQLRTNTFGENPVHIAISQILCPSTNKSTLIYQKDTRKFIKINRVFPTGLLLRGDELWMYYGAADSCTSLATAKLDEVLASLVD